MKQTYHIVYLYLTNLRIAKTVTASNTEQTFLYAFSNSFCRNILSCITVGMLFLSGNALAQGVNDTFLVVKPYEPVISDAHKIKDNPSIRDTGKIIPALQYGFIQTRANMPFSIISIEPAKIKGEPLVKLYHSYVKVGMGNNTTPLAEVYYNSVRNQSHQYGILARHFSSNGIHNIDYSGFSNNTLKLYGKKFLKKQTIFGGAFYNRDVVRFYGIDSLVSPVISDVNALKQNYTSFGGNAGVQSNRADTSALRYNVQTRYKYLYDIYNTAEHNGKLDAELGKYEDFEYYHLKVLADYNAYESLTDTVSNTILSLIPGVKSHSRLWQLHVGLHINAEIADAAKFRFYPNAEFRYNLISNIIVPYVGITGGLKRTNFDHFITENPFIRPNIELKNENTRYRGFFGIRGNFSSRISFNVALNHSQVAGMGMFVKDYSDIMRNKFAVVYDTADVTNFRTELAFQNREKLRILFVADYFMFDMRNQTEAWHRPNFKSTLSFLYDLADKVIIRMDIIGIDKQYALVHETIETSSGFTTIQTAVRIPGWIDANLGLEYRYTKRISAFINANNLLSKGYQRFQDYTVMRFNVLGGFTYSF